MKDTETVSALQSLYRYHETRIAGYELGVKKLKRKSSDLNSVFANQIRQSREALGELTAELAKLDAQVLQGKTRKSWSIRLMVPFLFGGLRKVLLKSHLSCETTIQQQYLNALDNEKVSKDVKPLLTHHLSTLKSAYQRIKSLYKER